MAKREVTILALPLFHSDKIKINFSSFVFCFHNTFKINISLL